MIHRNDFYLIDINAKTSLLLHTPSLQLYPLDKEKNASILDYLSHITYQQPLKGNYTPEDINTIRDFLEQTIRKAPKSKEIKLNKQKRTFTNVVLPIVSSCNLACPYCFAQTDGGFHFKTFSKEQIEKTIDFIVKKTKNNITLVFFGGEPLLRFDLIQYTIDYIGKKYGNISFHYSITTNGTLINDEIIEFFREHNFSVLVSIDGPDNEFNVRRYKNGEKSIQTVIDNIKRLKENKVNIELRATLLNINPYICETFRFFEELEIPFNVVFAYESENKGHKYADYGDSVLEGIERQLENLYDYYEGLILADKNIFNKKCFETRDKIRFRIKRNISCAAGRLFFTITSDGDIFSCSHFMNNKEKVIGNIYDEKVFNDNWESMSPPTLRSKKGCADCWAKHFCDGGCTAQIIHAGRGTDAPLPKNECTLTKEETKMYIKICYLALHRKREMNENAC